MEGKKWESVCAVVNRDESAACPSASSLHIRAETVEVASELHLFSVEAVERLHRSGPQGLASALTPCSAVR